MAKFDLNDREFSDFKEQTDFFPRSNTKYKVDVLSFEKLETDDRVGWEVKFKILTVKNIKKHELFEPPAEVGETRGLWLCRVQPVKFKVKDDMQWLRSLLAAMTGEEHTPEFDAAGALEIFENMDDEDLQETLAPIEIYVDSKVSKPKEVEDEDTGEMVMRQFVNPKYRFSYIED